jgi:hypothetical protein
MPDFADLPEPSPEELALGEVETARQRDGEPELEQSLSINDWIDRIKACCQGAHQAARAGAVEWEVAQWAQVGQIAVGRIAYLLKVQSESTDG